MYCGKLREMNRFRFFQKKNGELIVRVMGFIIEQDGNYAPQAENYLPYPPMAKNEEEARFNEACLLREFDQVQGRIQAMNIVLNQKDGNPKVKIWKAKDPEKFEQHVKECLDIEDQLQLAKWSRGIISQELHRAKQERQLYELANELLPYLMMDEFELAQQAKFPTGKQTVLAL